MNRRQILTGLGSAALAAGPARAVEKPLWMSPQLPDGTREEATLEALPGKQKLIRLADRPPNYEAPIETFRTAITPNDQFFVRYHLAGIPPMADLGKWSLAVGGDAANGQITLSLDDLRNEFRAGGGGGGVPVFRQSPRPVVSHMSPAWSGAMARWAARPGADRG